MVWGRVGHLLGVRNSEALRAAHSVVQPEVVACSLRLSQSRPLYRALGRLRECRDELDLDASQRRVVDLLLRDAELAGVALEGERRARFTAIEKELAELATTYSNHVLDATRAFALVLRRPEEIEGLPTSLLELAAQAAREAGESDASAESGPWRITLAPPSYRPFMEHGVRRDLREQLFRAQLTRASEGAGSNAPLLSRILGLRREQARLLERPTYADLSLASKSAPDVAGVRRLLEQLRREALPAARRELEELREFACPPIWITMARLSTRSGTPNGTS